MQRNARIEQKEAKIDVHIPEAELLLQSAKEGNLHKLFQILFDVERKMRTSVCDQMLLMLFTVNEPSSVYSDIKKIVILDYLLSQLDPNVSYNSTKDKQLYSLNSQKEEMLKSRRKLEKACGFSGVLEPISKLHSAYQAGIEDQVLARSGDVDAQARVIDKAYKIIVDDEQEHTFLRKIEILEHLVNEMAIWEVNSVSLCDVFKKQKEEAISDLANFYQDAGDFMQAGVLFQRLHALYIDAGETHAVPREILAIRVGYCKLKSMQANSAQTKDACKKIYDNLFTASNNILEYLSSSSAAYSDDTAQELDFHSAEFAVISVSISAYLDAGINFYPDQLEGMINWLRAAEFFEEEQIFRQEYLLCKLKLEKLKREVGEGCDYYTSPSFHEIKTDLDEIAFELEYTEPMLAYATMLYEEANYLTLKKEKRKNKKSC